MKRSRALWLAAVLLLTAANGWAEQKPSRLPVQDRDLEKLLGTDYYGVYVLGKQVGWAKISFTRSDDGEIPCYLSRLEVSEKITASGVKTELQILQTEEFSGKPPYTFTGGLSRETDGRSVHEIKLTRTAKGFDVLIRTGDEKVRKQISALDYTLADLTTIILWLGRGPKLGEMITTQSLDFDDLKIDKEVHKLTATKTAIAEGVKVTYHELAITNPKDGSTSLARYDQKGEKLLSMRIAGQIELRVEPERLAKQTEFGGDLFELGKVKIDKKLGDKSTISSLILETVGKHDLGLKLGPCQGVLRNDSGTYTVKLGKAYGQPVEASAQEIVENCAETATYPISHAKIQALAKEAVGDAKTAEAKVKALVRFVSRYITPSYTAQPLTVMDLLKGRKGDCKHYALLLTTLARAAGIPAREVGGLVYLGDDEKALGFHAWNEVVVDGHWVPVDASAGETEINPTHINFGSGTGDQTSNMFAAFGKLSFRVVDVQYRK
jgi:hypothetical protein